MAKQMTPINDCLEKMIISFVIYIVRYCKFRKLKTSIVPLGIIVLLCVPFGIILSTDFDRSTRDFNLRRRLDDQNPLNSSSFESNATRLWTIRFADENDFHLARLLPCRSVVYSGPSIADKFDSCDNSSLEEFTVENTLKAQEWLYKYQHPKNCTNKRLGIISGFAWSGFGSSFHQIVWAFGKALADDRIAVYETPGEWLYGGCNLSNPNCIFLPISNCSAPSQGDENQTIYIDADAGRWLKPTHPPIFRNRTFNWYRTQLVFYLMRFKPETLTLVQNNIAHHFYPKPIDFHQPYIAVYVRRSDKVKGKEMSQAYSLKRYFDLFDHDARRANITRVYLNSEDGNIFKEFSQLNKEYQDYYTLLSINSKRNVMYNSLIRMLEGERQKIVIEFLSDLFIEINAHLHVGTLTSNWCRLVDELKLALGKTIPYYTPEGKYLLEQ